MYVNWETMNDAADIPWKGSREIIYLNPWIILLYITDITDIEDRSPYSVCPVGHYLSKIVIVVITLNSIC